ncbi:ATP-binding cassette domain-containing protein [Azohydromonas sediminis]|uniref:ATP-binding cassette domain-containing protein n=1 Tax=Azohydromonas sediminis TaxID=2259674 RepID=UPI001B35476D|nr:ATP-binding cassette domain-containing protein [Azohydromonas sediminis]
MILRLVDAVAGYDHPVTPPVSLTLDRGEVVGLAGPNGVGKSTLVKAVLGTATWFGGYVERAPGVRVGYLSQSPVRLPEAPLSGAELLAAVGARAMVPPARLAAKLAVRIDRWSGGEYQLLMLWAALASPAGLVLLDEPTNHLDASHIQTAREAIAAVRAQRAALVVSHDRAFLAAVCTRVVELNTPAVPAGAWPLHRTGLHDAARARVAG